MVELVYFGNFVNLSHFCYLGDFSFSGKLNNFGNFDIFYFWLCC